MRARVAFQTAFLLAVVAVTAMSGLRGSADRPADPKSDERSDNFDIWAMDKLPSGAWGEPRRLDAPVNSPGSEFYPRMAADGTLYFGSERPGGRGGADLWRCRQVNGAFQPAENLGDAINSAAAEFEPYITPDQQTLIFMAAGRDGNQSSDLFISTMRDGAWTPARSLGAPINSPRGREYAPKISPDGKWFFFSSTRSTWDRPNRTPMTTRDYEQRIHAPGNGLGDMYYIDVRALPQS